MKGIKMNKVFEDYFSEIQADMVSICLEYCEKHADNIYIYGSFESNYIFCDFYYRINEKLFSKNRINDALTNENEPKFDTSPERQAAVLRILNDDMISLIKLCKEYGREMPSELKIVYNVKKNSLKAEYRYGLIWTNDPVKTSHDIAMEWFEEVKREHESQSA